MLCFLSWIAVDAAAADDDDDDDDIDDLTSISRIMNIFYYLSWSVDFSTDDNDDDDDDDDVNAVYATDYSMTNIYLLTYHPPCCSMISLRLWFG